MARLAFFVSAPVLFLCARPAIAADAGEIAVNERAPIALLFVTPSQPTVADNLELVRRIDETLAAHTNLKLHEIDSQRDEVKACAGALVCLSQAARADFDPSATPPRHLIVVTNLGRGYGRPDRLSILLASVDAPKGPPADERSIVLSRAEPIDAPDTETAAAFLERVLSRDFRPFFEASRNWEPWGSISLSAPGSGMAIALDGRVVGRTQEGITKLTRVMTGKRSLSLEAPGFEPFATAVDVEANRSAEVTAKATRALSASSPLRTATTVSGIAAATAGAVITTLAIVEAKNAARVECLSLGRGRDTSACALDDQLLSFRHASNEDRVSPGSNPSSGKVLMAPLGLGLVALGATWSLGTWLLTAEDEVPWVPIAAGVLALVATYAAGAALNGSNGLR